MSQTLDIPGSAQEMLKNVQNLKPSSSSGFMDSVIVHGYRKNVNKEYFRLRDCISAKNYGPFFSSYYDLMLAVAYAGQPSPLCGHPDISVWTPSKLELDTGLRQVRKIRSACGEYYEVFAKQIIEQVFGPQYLDINARVRLVN